MHGYQDIVSRRRERRFYGKQDTRIWGKGIRENEAGYGYPPENAFRLHRPVKAAGTETEEKHRKGEFSAVAMPATEFHPVPAPGFNLL